MNTLHFTEAELKRLPRPEKGRETWRDDEDKHLYLRATALALAWYSVRSVKGRMVWTKLGTWPAVSVAEARKLSAATSGQAEEPRRRDTTLADLWERYYRVRVEGRLRSAPEYARIWTRFLEPYGRIRADKLDREAVAVMHRQWGTNNGKIAANRAVEVLRACLSWAVDCELVDRNPAAKVERFPEQSRDRFLDADELARLFAALDEYPDRQWSDFFRLLLFTGARRSNVEGMAWADVDLSREVWTIPGEQSKNGEPMRLPLAGAAVEILTRRRAAAGRNPWVFPGRGKDGHVTNPAKAWREICAAAELVDVRMHDLRRTLGSWQAAGGASLLVIGRSLGHRSQAATAVYARLDLDPVRASVEAAVAAMMGPINKPPPNP